MEWISVNDRLPEDDERITMYDSKYMKGTRVLVFNGAVKVVNRINVYNDLNFFGLKNTNGWVWENCEEVTHWMPLPEPPKE